MCICWSPDGKYVLTGGQDDLVSVWSLGERRIVARCPGHQSWVTAVAFDRWRCDDRNYRFGSVGEDRRLLLWDFNVGMLHRPKAVSYLDLIEVNPCSLRLRFQKSSVRQRSSLSSNLPMARNRAESQVTTARLRSNSNLTSNSVDDENLIEHPVESRTRTAELPPVMVSFSCIIKCMSNFQPCLIMILPLVQNRRHRSHELDRIRRGLYHYGLQQWPYSNLGPA